jgi:hypothetical protein
MKKSIKAIWHDFWLRLNLQRVEDCLDDLERNKYAKKVDYHRVKLEASV